MTNRVSGHSVSFIVGQLVLGGAEKQLFILVRELISLDWRVQVISLNVGHGDYWEDPIRKLGARLDGVTACSPLRRVPEITSLLKATRPRIVQSWSEFTNAYAALCGRLAGAGARVGSQQSNEHFTVKSLGWPGYLLSFRGLSGVLSNSRAAITEIEARFPGLRVAYMPNAMDPLPVHDRNAVRKLLSISPDALVVGSVGALIGVKRFDLLIDAVGILRDGGLHCQLMLVGDGPLRDSLYEHALATLGPSGFRGMGECVNVTEILFALDVFALASDDEGTPNVLLEAMGCGVPVAARAVGDVPNLVVDGRTGILVRSGSPIEMAHAIRRLLEDRSLAERAAEEGKRLVRSNYSSERMVTAITSFYDELVAMSPSHLQC